MHNFRQKTFLFDFNDYKAQHNGNDFNSYILSLITYIILLSKPWELS